MFHFSAIDFKKNNWTGDLYKAVEEEKRRSGQCRVTHGLFVEQATSSQQEELSIISTQSSGSPFDESPEYELGGEECWCSRLPQEHCCWDLFSVGFVETKNKQTEFILAYKVVKKNAMLY